MKKALAIKGIAIFLAVLTLAVGMVGCRPSEDNGEPGGGSGPTLDLAALEAELALEITEEGDYTEESYRAYSDKLAAARALLSDAAATQEKIDTAVAELKAARLALAVRTPVEVGGAHKSITLLSGFSKEIAISDYINAAGLSGITYTVEASSDALTLGEPVDDKFTVTAGEVTRTEDVTVTITVLQGGVNKLEVVLSVQVTEAGENPIPGLTPDDNVDTDW